MRSTMPTDYGYSPPCPKPEANGIHSIPESTKQPPKAPFNNAVYYSNKRFRENCRTPACLRPQIISHVYYAYANVAQTGHVHLSDPYVDAEAMVDGARGCIRACTNLKRSNPNLKVILSIGGEQASRIFQVVAADFTARHNFGRTALDLVHQFQLDGIDLNWHLPESGQDGLNYLQLLSVIRRHYLPPNEYIVTAAIPGNSWRWRHLSVRDAACYLDLINLKCYDFAGPWSTHTGHQSQLYPSSLPCNDPPPLHGMSVVQELTAEGVPPRKILLGVPLFGVSFPGTTHIGMAFERQDGVRRDIEYCQLPLPDAAEDVDTSAVAAYCVGDERTGFVTYDNPTTVIMKAGFVKENKLAGLFYWEGTSDVATERSLIYNAYTTLHDF